MRSLQRRAATSESLDAQDVLAAFAPSLQAAIAEQDDVRRFAFRAGVAHNPPGSDAAFDLIRIITVWAFAPGRVEFFEKLSDVVE